MHERQAVFSFGIKTTVIDVISEPFQKYLFSNVTVKRHKWDNGWIAHNAMCVEACL